MFLYRKGSLQVSYDIAKAADTEKSRVTFEK